MLGWGMASLQEGGLPWQCLPTGFPHVSLPKTCTCDSRMVASAAAEGSEHQGIPRGGSVGAPHG